MGKHGIYIVILIHILCVYGISVDISYAGLRRGPGSDGENVSSAVDSKGKGAVQIDLSDITGRDRPGFIELYIQGVEQPALVVDVPDGRKEISLPVGKYKAYIRVYDAGVPLLVKTKEFVVSTGSTSYILLNLVEGAIEEGALSRFDRDHDMVIDRVELEEGTELDDPRSIPSRRGIPVSGLILKKSFGWYRGELHIKSNPEKREASIREIVSRAEKMKLDFLAITDPELSMPGDFKGFDSKSVVLIPAMEWTSERGTALIFGPRTLPETAHTPEHAIAILSLVQLQGGIVAIAHPSFRDGSWQWGPAPVNAIEVWCRNWEDELPLGLGDLREELRERKNGRLVYPIAQTAAMQGLSPLDRLAYVEFLRSIDGDKRNEQLKELLRDKERIESEGKEIRFAPGVSANDQAVFYWDQLLARRQKACIIGGSLSTNPKKTLANPVTYVFAQEKSLKGILDGIRWGRTYVSSGVDGPQIHFVADVSVDGRIDVSLGGVIPVGIVTEFEIGVRGGKDKKVQVFRNGRVIQNSKIEENNFLTRIRDKPTTYSVYRVRVTEPGTLDEGYGVSKVLAMSSPIYAAEMMFVNPDVDIDKMRIKVENKWQEDAIDHLIQPKR